MKKWHFLVSKALERRYCNIMLVPGIFLNNSILIINCKYNLAGQRRRLRGRKERRRRLDLDKS
jgi:hypothetical protein